MITTRRELRFRTCSKEPPSTDFGQKIQEYHLSEPAGALEFIRFQNFYTGTVTVKQRFPGGGHDSFRWTTVLKDFVLMKHMHYEDGAEAWHQLHIGVFNDKFDKHNATHFRFCLSQPSPVWEKVLP